MIYQTVGGVGADHANWFAVITYLNGLGAFADDVTITQTGSTVDNTTNALNYNLNGKTLLITVGDDAWHKGVPTAGFTCDVQTNIGLRFHTTGTGTQTIERLNLRRSGTVINTAVIGLGGVNVGIAPVTILRDVLCDCSGQGDGINIGSRAEEYAYAYNVKVWGAARYGFNADKTSYWPFHDTRGRQVYENITAYDCVNGIYADSVNDVSGTWNSIFRNCVSSGCSASDWLITFVISDLSEFYNCADEDGTVVARIGAVNCQTGVVPADNFVSLLEANPKFLFLPNGQLLGLASAIPSKGNGPLLVKFNSQAAYQYPNNQLSTNGIDPTYATTDITGAIEYGENGVYSIGCHQAGLEGAE